MIGHVARVGLVVFSFWYYWILLGGLSCSSSSIEGDRRFLRSAHGVQTVSMLDGGATGVYYDVGEEAGRLRPDAGRVVLLGMGGGEMLRAARRSLPRTELVGVEVDGEVAASAISDFKVLEFGVRVVVDDGRDWLAEQPAHSIDVLMVDVFDDQVLPERFRDENFYRLAWLGLGREGLLVQNIFPPELAAGVVEQLEGLGFHHVHRRGLMEGNVLVFAEP